MAKWICTICEWVYDEGAEGVPFNELPDDWVCPSCGVDKSFFEKQSD
ncbi:MAG: rubredoxin [Halobacteriota archaeon]